MSPCQNRGTCHELHGRTRVHTKHAREASTAKQGLCSVIFKDNKNINTNFSPYFNHSEEFIWCIGVWRYTNW